MNEEISNLSGTTDIVVLHEIDSTVDKNKAIACLRTKSKESNTKFFTFNVTKEGRPSSPDKWRSLVERQSDFVHELKMEIQKLGIQPRIHIFSHSPIPLAIHLGATFSNWMDVVPYQFDKGKKEWIPWTDGAVSDLIFTVSGLPKESVIMPGSVIIMISVTQDISPQVKEVETILSDRLTSIHLLSNGLGHNAIPSASHAVKAAKEFREILDKTSTIFPKATSVHLFYSGPLALATLLGLQINPNVHPPIVSYEYGRAQVPHYQEVVRIGAESKPPLSESLSPEFIKDPFRNTPLMSYFSHKIKEKPLSGKRILILLHFLRDLIPFVQAMLKLGLDPSKSYFYYKKYPYPQRDVINRWLLGQGCNVRPLAEMDADLEILEHQIDVSEKVLIIEDGGHIYPRILGKYPELLKRVHGCVEQTTRGRRNIEEALKTYKKQHKTMPNIPILNVADAKLKEDFEPPHVADAVVRNIRNFLGDVDFRGKSVAVLGYGTIGEKLAEKLKQEGMRVTAFDPDSHKTLKVSQVGLELSKSSSDAVRDKFLVIGTSGDCSIGRNEILELSHYTHLASTSSEQYEFAISELESLSGGRSTEFAPEGKIVGTIYRLRAGEKEVVLLANGYPINFWGLNSMPDQASDLIMTLLLLSLVDVAREDPKKSGIDTNRVNELAKEYDVAELYRRHHFR